MTIYGDSLADAYRRQLISIIDSPLEDFEPMPEGDKQRRNLSYVTEALYEKIITSNYDRICSTVINCSFIVLRLLIA
jgi:hypothetical protein